MECEYCKKILSCKSSLINHKKTNKQCLDKQNKNISNILELCEYCNKSFSTQNLKKHLLICKSKLKVLNEQKEIEIEKLQEELKNKENICVEKDNISIKEDLIYENKNSNLEIQILELEFKYKLEYNKLEFQCKKDKDNDKRQDIIKLFKENILSFEQFEKCLSVL